MNRDCYESEIDNKKHALFWDSLGNYDKSWKSIIKFFIIRFAILQC